MMSLEEYKNLGGLILLVFIVTLAVMYVFATIIENKKKKSSRRKKRCASVKMNKIIANYDKFIEENTKNMYIFEIDEFKKNLNNEIYRMLKRV